MKTKMSIKNKKIKKKAKAFESSNAKPLNTQKNNLGTSRKRKKTKKKPRIRNIPLSSPFIGRDDIRAVNSVLKTRWLSLGPKLREFEKMFAAFIGTKYAVAVNSGTSALHLCIKTLGIGKGDEVIVTPFSFIASANCALFEGAKPVFVDIDPKTFNIDTSKVEKKITKRTKAIIVVDIFGRPVERDAIKRIAKKHKLKIIEDSAEALGAEYKGKKVGAFGDCGIFAFYPNKQMTTGEGGMIVTNDKKIYELCLSYRNQGRSASTKWLDHERMGYNYRISDINCALGISQLKKIKKILKKRERVAKEYTKRLEKLKGIKIPFSPTKDSKVSWFVYVIQVPKRDEFIKNLSKKGVQCSNYFPPIHLMSYYRKEHGHRKGSYPICERISKTTLALPFYTHMKKKDINYVCDRVKEVHKKLSKISANKSKKIKTKKAKVKR